jgi:hypothetical protein
LACRYWPAWLATGRQKVFGSLSIAKAAGLPGFSEVPWAEPNPRLLGGGVGVGVAVKKVVGVRLGVAASEPTTSLKPVEAGSTSNTNTLGSVKPGCTASPTPKRPYRSSAIACTPNGAKSKRRPTSSITRNDAAESADT